MASGLTLRLQTLQCRSTSIPSRARQPRLTLRLQTPLNPWRLRSKTKMAFLRFSNAWSLEDVSLRMAWPCRAIASRRIRHWPCLSSKTVAEAVQTNSPWTVASTSTTACPTILHASNERSLAHLGSIFRPCVSKEQRIADRTAKMKNLSELKHGHEEFLLE